MRSYGLGSYNGSSSALLKNNGRDALSGTNVHNPVSKIRNRSDSRIEVSCNSLAFQKKLAHTAVPHFTF